MDIRIVNNEELESARVLSDQVFRDSDQKSMGTAFPNVFSSSLQQSFGAFEENRLVSFMGLVPSVVRIGSAKLNIYSLGSVCTHPDERDKGYASKILTKIKQHINKAGSSLLLVSGTRSLYTRAYCHEFGLVKRFSIDETFTNVILKNPHMSKDTIVREWESTDWHRLYNIACTKKIGFEQSVWDMATLLHAESLASCIHLRQSVLIAECNDDIQGFIVLGTPDRTDVDTPAQVLEWAGDARTVLYLLVKAMDQHRLPSIDIPVSWYETELLTYLSTLDSHNVRNLGTVYIVNSERLIEQLRPYFIEKHEHLGRTLQIKQLNEDQSEITIETYKLRVDSKTLVSLLFDPEYNLKTSQDPALLEIFKALFPIPFPYTAGLNYV